MTRSTSLKLSIASTEVELYTLEVFIISGPIAEDFAKNNPSIGRTIQIRSDQTLEDLHEAIFDAFDRDDPHMYEFQIGGNGPQDPKSKRYSLPMALEYEADMATMPTNKKSPQPGTVDATIGSLGLEVDDVFGYWFDFGDDWWHQIDVTAIIAPPGTGKYPRVVQRIGASPPQYIDWEVDDEYHDDFGTDQDESTHAYEADDVDGSYDADAHLNKLTSLIPDALEEHFLDIADSIDLFCDDELNEEYKMVSRILLARLCTTNLPLSRNKPESWAAAIIYLIGQVNFLTDPSQNPHMKTTELAKCIGVSKATFQNKATQIRKVIDINQMDPQWILPSMLQDHPIMQMLNNFMLDPSGFILPKDDQTRLN